MLGVPSPEECVQRFEKADLDPASGEYLRFHARRFSYLVDIVVEASKEFGPACRILDVGPGFQTALIRDALPGAVVDTLGYYDGRYPHRPHEEHVTLDLNEAQNPANCPPASSRYDLIVMAEVIEHIYTAPHLVLQYLGGWLRPAGLLIVQTPNAVALGRRITMVCGRNPYEMIRDQRQNPGHFREYTVDELGEIGEAAGFRRERFECRNYFGVLNLRRRVANLLSRTLPGRLEEGITAWFRKTDNRTKI